jgi:prophage tail gpP-like protein
VSDDRERIRVVTEDGVSLINWIDYDVEIDLLTPGDTFRCSIAPPRRDVWDAVKPDTIVTVYLGESPLLTGIIDERNASSGTPIEIAGGDKATRLVLEAAELATFDEGTILDAIATVARPWYTDVITSNAKNRALILGRRATKAAIAGGEPIAGGGVGLSIAQSFLPPGTAVTVIPGKSGRRQGPKKVEPGERKWEVIQHFLELDRLLAWGAADGSALIVAKPNYNQAPQFRLVAPSPGSERKGDAGVIDWQYGENLRDLYSEVNVVGSSPGNAARYGRSVTAHAAQVLDGDGPRGIGNRFRRQKVDIVPDHEIKNREQAHDKAVRRKVQQNANHKTVNVTVRGHRQPRFRNAEPALYAPDTMCEIILEPIGIEGEYLITRCAYSGSKGSRRTEMTLVPKGTDLSA